MGPVTFPWKSYSCFSAKWELDDQQYFPEAKNNSACFRLSSESSIAPEAPRVEEVNDEETVDMSHDFFHGFLAIGTLGSASITKEPVTPKVAMPFESSTEEETRAAEDELQSPNNKLEKPIDKEVYNVSNESSKGRVVSLDEKETKHMGTKENKSTVVHPLKEYSEMPATKEKTKEQKTMPENFPKKNATSYKKSGKLDKGEKRETPAKNFMKKMLKKLDFTSRCSPTSASANAIFCNSTEKPTKPTKVFWKSRKIHPEAPGLHVNKSHNYEFKNLCYDEGYDKEAKFENEADKYPHMGMLKKETVGSIEFANEPHKSQPAGKNAYWIKTDAEYLVLEF
ncbi:protein LAZY 1-like [Cynara cardunculus var. scolymus]|uniref:protein LAZY 1-like n=1 Tax=Cynara cardunculus var. scolymus TaxID=59895 RepID=UPI000D622EEE|nr:protein LAZY 1-like [Cynara cardunculus var. scolymus]